MVPLVSDAARQAGRPRPQAASLAGQAVRAAARSAVAQPQGLKLDGRFAADAQAARAALQAARPDVMVVAAYGLILPPWVLELPRLGCLNIHASLLPRWRGAAPIQRAIEAGDAETGITIMQMDAGLDTGDMLLVGLRADPRRRHQLPACRIGWPRSARRLMVQALADAARGALPRTPQPAGGVTYAHKLAKAEAAIDWQRPAAEIERRLRAFDPQPGCHFEFDGQTVKLWRAKVSAGFGAAPGTIAIGGDTLRVACGDGQALELLELQRAGGRRLPVAAFLASR